MARGRANIRLGGEEAEGKSVEPTRLNEEDVLLPVLNQLHPDNWPCFVLHDAVVFGKDGKTLASLLEAELDGPLIVRGRLEVDKEFRPLLKFKPRDSEVEVSNVKGFSMGIGPVTLWASGKAGWFEIRPAPLYKGMYDKMVEGITLHYFLTDLYENKRLTAVSPGVNADKVFEEYRRQIDSTKSLSQVAQLCEEHATFLLSQMRKPSEPVRWMRTGFYLWLIKRCPDIHSRYIRKHCANIPVIKIESDDEVPVFKTRSSKNNEGNLSTTAVIVNVMKELHTSGAICHDSMTLDMLSKVLHERYDIAGVNLAGEVIMLHAKTILTSLTNEWITSPIYSRLEEGLNQPGKPGRKSALRREAKMIELRARNNEAVAFDDETAQKYAAKIESPAITRGRRKRSYESEQEENSTSLEEGQGAITNNRSQRSIEKGKAKESAANEIDARPIRRAGKMASLRLAGSTFTRENLTESPTRGVSRDRRSNKRPKMSHSANHDDSEATSSTDASPYLGGQLEDDKEETENVLTIVTRPLPSTSPQGVNGLWTCPTEGCKFLVGSADKPEAQVKIRAHFLEHAEEISKMECLVLEESRPYLPTNHLLEKLRALGEAARLSEERRIDGKIVPAPIKRRMVV